MVDGRWVIAALARVLVAGTLALAAGAACQRGGERQQALQREVLTTRTLGLAYLEENQLDEAAAEFLKLTQLAPKEPLGFANLGLTYLRQANYPEAERRIRRALQLTPRDPDIRLMLAKVLELTDRAPEARQVLEGTVADAPEHLKSWYALAQLSADPNDPEARRRREG
jgi:predicted Zn-dependent protease